MKSRSGETIKLTSIDELLGVVNEESAMEIEINRMGSINCWDRLASPKHRR